MARKRKAAQADPWDNSAALREARKLRNHMRRKVLDPLNGFPLGRLKQDGLITPEEFEAATAWIALVYRYAALKGFRLPMCKALDLGKEKGFALATDPEDDKVRRVEQRKGEWDRAIVAADREGLQIMTAICIQEIEPQSPIRLKRVLAALVMFHAA